MDKQRGGAFTVNGWLALTLLALLAVTGLYAAHLLRHRQIVINFDHTSKYGVHTFPANRGACDGFNTICWTTV
jgi:hypothetical protein